MSRANLTKLIRGAAVGGTLLAVAVAATPAHAVIVTPGSNPSEPGLYQLMNQFYGAGNWQQIDNSVVQTAVNNVPAIAVDFNVRYAGDASTFGIFKDGTTFTPFMSTTTAGATPTSVLITSDMLSSNFGGIYEKGLRDDTTGQLFSSNESKNADGRAHLIEFQILSMPNTYVMAWEDQIGGDYDYNDLILEYTRVLNPRPVPEPMTLSLLASALILVGGSRRLLQSKRPPHA